MPAMISNDRARALTMAETAARSAPERNALAVGRKVTWRAQNIPSVEYDDGSVGVGLPQTALDIWEAAKHFYNGENPQPSDAVLAGLVATGGGAAGFARAAGRNALNVGRKVAGAERAGASGGPPSVAAGSGPVTARVYRGTRMGDAKRPSGSDAWWASDKPEVADHYAATGAAQIGEDFTPAITPADISFKNPMLIDAQGRQFHDLPGEFHNTFYAEKAARERGHDGLVIHNVVDDGPPSTVYAAIGPNTVKSAHTGEILNPGPSHIGEAGRLFGLRPAPTHFAPNRYSITKDGQPFGIVDVSVRDGKAVIDAMRSDAPLGVSGVRGLQEAFRQLHPDVTEFSGTRISGAKVGGGEPATQTVRFPGTVKSATTGETLFANPSSPTGLLPMAGQSNAEQDMDRNALNVRAPLAAPPPPPPAMTAPPSDPAPQAAPAMTFEQAFAELMAAQQDLDGDGVADGQQAPAPVEVAASAPERDAAPPSAAGRNALFPSGGALPNYGFGPVTQTSKMGQTPTAEGEIANSAEPPQQYTHMLDEMTPPPIPGGAAIARVLPKVAGLAAAGYGASAMTSGTSDADESPEQNLQTQRAKLLQELDAAKARRETHRPQGRAASPTKDPNFTTEDNAVKALEAQLTGVDATLKQTADRNSPEHQQDVARRAEQIAADLKKKEAATPFRELHPGRAAALAVGGMAASVLVPAAAGVKGNMATLFKGSVPGRVRNALNVAEQAMASGTPEQKEQAARLLRAYIADKPGPIMAPLKAVGKGAAAAGSGAALAAEGTMIPDQLDAGSLPEGPAKELARERSLNPANYVERAATGVLTGLSGYKMGKFAPSKTADYPRANALAEGLEASARRAAGGGGGGATPAPPGPIRQRTKNGRIIHKDDAGRFTSAPE